MSIGESTNILRDAKSIVAACERRGLLKRSFANGGAYMPDKKARVFSMEHRQKLREARFKQITKTLTAGGCKP